MAIKALGASRVEPAKIAMQRVLLSLMINPLKLFKTSYFKSILKRLDLN
ncbi:hypothetical protein CSQ_1962 [Campylobacter jejuni subsp. jejuni DFVF1099]|nr:hypothetical protein CSQ_1962 [Campylobacter jejuni subsp. jejuni DFVF1099]